MEISHAIGDEPLIANNNGNLGNAYRCVGRYKFSLSYLERSIKLFDRIFFNMVPHRSKLFYAGKYFNHHKVSTACLLALGKYKAAMLVLDHGRAKELNFSLQKQEKISTRCMEEYVNSVTDRVNAGEEDRELKEFEVILQNETCSTVGLVFAFDLEIFLNVWIVNKSLIDKKLDVTLEELYLVIIEFLRKLNVSVCRNYSFFNLNLPPITNKNIMFPPEIRKENSSSKHAQMPKILSDHEILQVLFQLMIDPLKDLIDCNKLIIVPDGPLFFAQFSSLIDEHSCYLSESYSIQITPSLHSLRASMKKSQDPNLGFALFVGNPAVGEVSLLDGVVFTPSDLPMAAEEVKCVANFFQAAPFLGHKAQKKRFY